MRIGRHDIRHLAIIGVAGVAGLLATVAVFGATERPRVQRNAVRMEMIRAPVAANSIRIVGSSLDVSPIVYIDGVRVNGPGLHPGEARPSLDDLTPEEIAGIDVVKGGQAAERFGTEGGERGVILVTTKEGKKEAGKGSEEGR